MTPGEKFRAALEAEKPLQVVGTIMAYHAVMARRSGFKAIYLALYPLSAFRAMNKAALQVYSTLRREGTQKNTVAAMQTRAELYDFLDYHAYEKKLDELFTRERPA